MSQNGQTSDLAERLERLFGRHQQPLQAGVSGVGGPDLSRRPARNGAPLLSRVKNAAEFPQTREQIFALIDDLRAGLSLELQEEGEG